MAQASIKCIEIRVAEAVEADEFQRTLNSSSLEGRRALSSRGKDDSITSKDLDAMIDRFRNRGGEDDLAGSHLDEACNRGASIFDQVSHHQCFFVGASRIALRNLEDFTECLSDFGSKGRTRRMVEISAHLGASATVEVAASLRTQHHRRRAVADSQALEEASHHPAVNSTQDWMMFRCFSEGAVVSNH